MSNHRTFLSEKHEEQYNTLLNATCYPHDKERQAMFYIIAGNNELFSYINKIYDFTNEELIISANLGKLKAICSSSKSLLKLAIQFYNSVNNKQSVYDTFKYLDNENKRLACEGIKIRFSF
jgi:hypothetical protein